jgi:hypothetical protein
MPTIVAIWSTMPRPMRPTPTTPTSAGLERRASSSARYTSTWRLAKPVIGWPTVLLSGSREMGEEGALIAPRLKPTEANLRWRGRLDAVKGFELEDVACPNKLTDA